MQEVVFIGDELSAAAYRLAGVHVIVAAPEETAAVIQDRLPDGVRLVLIGAAHAGAVAWESLVAMIRHGDPAVMVVPAAAGEAPGPDFSTWLRQRLGVAI